MSDIMAFFGFAQFFMTKCAKISPYAKLILSIQTCKEDNWLPEMGYSRSHGLDLVMFGLKEFNRNTLVLRPLSKNHSLKILSS